MSEPMSQNMSNLSHEKRSRAWWQSGASQGLALLVVGAAGGFFGYQVLAGSGRSDPLREISNGFLYIDLDTEGDVVARTALFSDQRVPTRKRQVFQWAQPTFRGELEQEALSLLVQAGRAESLEGRLSPSAAAEMAASMVTPDKELKEMILLVEEENTEAKKELGSREGRHVLLKRGASEQGPAYSKLKKMARLTQGGKGVVWADLHPEGSLQLILLWEEWPGLKKLHDRRDSMLARRKQRVRQWIEQTFARKGMTLFGL